MRASRFALIFSFSVSCAVVTGAICALASAAAPPPAYETPACGTEPAIPPLTVHLPDGSAVPATRLVYDTGARTVHVVGYPRIFCSGVE